MVFGTMVKILTHGHLQALRKAALNAQSKVPR